MDRNIFDAQVSRILETYGERSFPRERAKLLWSEVQCLSNFWMIQIVDYFIGSLRQSPLISDFRDQIARERERLWKTEKDQHREESEAAMKSIYSGDDLSMICKTIRDRIQGRVSDRDWECNLQLLNSAPISLNESVKKTPNNAHSVETGLSS